MGDAFRRLRTDLNASPTREADVGVVLDELGLEAVGVKAALEISEAIPLLLGPRQLHAAGEFLQMPHHGGGVDTVTQGLDHRIGHHASLAARGDAGATSSGSGWPARSTTKKVANRLSTPASMT